jgi:ribosome maturation factor RimP
VSSPGLDRPLKREADFLRFAGQLVAVTLKEPFQGRKSWQGQLTVADGGGFSLAISDGKTGQALGFTLAEVRDARLVPVLDFKGRKSKDKAMDSARAEAADTAPTVDGG